jgi:hypothetical protein
MKYLIRLACAGALFIGVPAIAHAQQQLQLQINDGRVTLHAENVPIRQILAEWARVGGTTILNAERLTAPPVTLDLRNVPERQAMDTLLRGTAGYVLGARPEALPGFSSIDRVIILASSNVAPPAPAPAFTNGPATRIPVPLPQPQVDPNDPEENPPDTPQPRAVPRPFLRRPQPLPEPLDVDEPAVTEPDAGDAPPQEEPTGAVAPTTGNPFGVPRGTSATPGTITPVPQPQGGRTPRIQDPD